MKPISELHERPNGVWSLTMAELNKWLFFSAYKSRIDQVAIQRAIMEAQSFLEKNEPGDKSVESTLLKKWKARPPKTYEDWKYWIAIHQQHLFLGEDQRGGMLSQFPALRRASQKADYQLTQLFYNALRDFSF